jgi:hypothetical protein
MELRWWKISKLEKFTHIKFGRRNDEEYNLLTPCIFRMGMNETNQLLQEMICERLELSLFIWYKW